MLEQRINDLEFQMQQKTQAVIDVQKQQSKTLLLNQNLQKENKNLVSEVEDSSIKSKLLKNNDSKMKEEIKEVK